MVCGWVGAAKRSNWTRDEMKYGRTVLAMTSGAVLAIAATAAVADGRSGAARYRLCDALQLERLLHRRKRGRCLGRLPDRLSGRCYPHKAEFGWWPLRGPAGCQLSIWPRGNWRGGFLGWCSSNGRQALPQSGLYVRSCAHNLFPATARVGYAFDRILPYIKGGYASSEVKSTASPPFVGFNDKQQLQGWALGAGLEYAVHRNVTIGVEYAR